MARQGVIKALLQAPPGLVSDVVIRHSGLVSAVPLLQALLQALLRQIETKD
jgi:hypothetical protein